ncbi:MAG: LysR substrate-binding domain-containing protein, partial [Burkholderiaceae bacterium]
KSVQSEELREQTMLLLGIGHCFRDHVLEVCPEAARYAQNSAGIQKTFEGSSLETIRHMVASGLGITVLPRMAIPPDNQDPMLSFIPFTPPAPTRRVVVVSRKSFSRQPAVESLRSVIAETDLPGCTKLIGASSFSKSKASGMAA